MKDKRLTKVTLTTTVEIINFYNSTQHSFNIKAIILFILDFPLYLNDCPVLLLTFELHT